MAKLVAILATTNHPFYYRTSLLAPAEAPPFAAEWVRKVANTGRRWTGPGRTCW